MSVPPALLVSVPPTLVVLSPPTPKSCENVPQLTTFVLQLVGCLDADERVGFDLHGVLAESSHRWVRSAEALLQTIHEVWQHPQSPRFWFPTLVRCFRRGGSGGVTGGDN